MSPVEDVSIPDSVRELCDRCFKACVVLRRVTFGSSSSLGRIGVSCFERTAIQDVNIPNSVRELCDRCFFGCQSLHRLTFGSSSSLERIGDSCFRGTQLVGLAVPSSVRHLGKQLYGPMPMTIFVADHKREFELECDPTDTIEDLWRKIGIQKGQSMRCWWPRKNLVFQERILVDGRTLEDYNIQHGATVEIRSMMRRL